MQRGRTALDSFPETIDLNQGSFPSNSSRNHSDSWDNRVTPVEDQISNMLASDDGNVSCMHADDNCAQNSSVWNRGESSSSANNLQERACMDDSKMRLGWSSSFNASPGTDPSSDNWSFEPSKMTGTSYGGNHLGMQTYGSNRASSLNISSNNEYARDNDCHRGLGVFQSHPLYESGHPQTEGGPTFVTSSGNTGHSSGASCTFLGNNDSPFGNWGSSCKRKALEGSSGQFYAGGSSSSSQPEDNTMQHSVPGCYTPDNSTVSSGTRNLTPTNYAEYVNSRNGVGLSRGAPSFPPSPGGPRISEGLTRNFTVRSSLGHYDSVSSDTSRGSYARNSGGYAAQQQSRPISNADSSQLRSAMTLPMNLNNTVAEPHLMHATEATGTDSYPWSASPGSRGGSSSSLMNSGERGPRVREEVSFRRSFRNRADYPEIGSAHGMGSISREEIDWSFIPGPSASSRNRSSGSRAGLSSGGLASSSAWLRHQLQTSQDHQRLSEAAPWIPFSHVESDSGIRRSHFELFPSGSSLSDEAATSSRAQHQSEERSAAVSTDVSGDGVSSFRSLAALENRHRLIHQVLSAMRRNRRLQAEDYVLLDPLINGFAELHDQHRDMRLDVDNMSYEELLALEEQIGNVSTGLSEEKIDGSMNQRKYDPMEISINLEPCCICQEDYIAGDDIGILDCDHEFHAGCIKQWLKLKNLCPICKKTGLKT